MVLEYDELYLFSHIPGLEVFNPRQCINSDTLQLRPPAPTTKPKEEWLEAWRQIPTHDRIHPYNHKEANLTLKLLNQFDAVCFHQVFEWVANNWSVLKEWGGTIYYRDMGQTNPRQEQLLQHYVKDGLKIIRYSPKNRTLPHYAGEHALIRFSKNPDEFLPCL